MRTIDDEEAALRLARAVLADIALFHAAEVQAGADLTQTIREARGLYHGRAASRFHGLFEVALQERGLAHLERGAAGAPAQGAGVQARLPEARPPEATQLPPLVHDSFLAPLPARRSSPVPALVVLVMLMALAGAALFFLTRG